MTVTAETFARGFDDRVAAVLPDAARRIEAFGERLRAAGIEPTDLVNIDSLSRVPVVSKDDLIDLQAERPPFGGLLAPDARVRRVFQSPGPLYEPEPDVPDPWRFAPALRAAGFSHDDLVLDAFGYHLSPAGAMFEEAALALGATVVPGGVGNLDLQVRACHDLGVTAYVGLPSYLKALLEKGDELGFALPLQRAFVCAEPLPDSLRAWLLERVPVVRQGYGTAEAGNLGFECEEMNGLHVPEDALVQICDVATGQPLWDGREGEVVVTLFSPDYPLVRFGTGDLSAFLSAPCHCGRSTPRLAGWLGRVGEAVKVRGMFLHPRQARAALASVDGVDRFRFVVDRSDERDVLRCEVLAAPDAELDELVESVRERIRSALRFGAEVEIVDAIDGDGLIVDRRSWNPTTRARAAGG